MRTLILVAGAVLVVSVAACDDSTKYSYNNADGNSVVCNDEDVNCLGDQNSDNRVLHEGEKVP